MYNTVQLETPAEEEEEESSRPCVECEGPRELLLHRSELIPPPVLGFEEFEENKYTSIKRRRMIVQCKEDDVEKNGYRHTDSQKCNTLTQSSPRTGLGKNNIFTL